MCCHCIQIPWTSSRTLRIHQSLEPGNFKEVIFNCYFIFCLPKLFKSTNDGLFGNAALNVSELFINFNLSFCTDMPLWDASVALCKYLQRAFPSSSLAGKTVIELGAGCGLPGIAAAILGANVTITDQAPYLPLIQQNITENLTEEEQKVCKQCNLLFSGTYTAAKKIHMTKMHKPAQLL